MERIVRQITDRLQDQLDPEAKYHKLEDLRSGSLPQFFVDRMELSLVSYLHDTLEPPSTHWADLDAPDMKQAWEHYLYAAEREVRLPKLYARNVVESCVEDILWLLVEPRNSLPLYLYEKKQELSREELERRLEWVVVYRHLARAILRYMDKKDLEVLTEKQCRRIVATVDERLTERYTPAEWMHLLEPWFELMDGEIEPDLLARFFREKAQMGWAATFENHKETVNRAGVVSVIEEVRAQPSDEDDEPAEEHDQQAAGEESLQARFESTESTRYESSRNGSENGKVAFLVEDDEEDEVAREEAEDSLNRQFSAPEDQDAVVSDMETEASETQGVTEEHNEPAEDEQPEEVSSDTQTMDEDEEDTPMWKRFMSPEDLEELEAEEDPEQGDEAEEEHTQSPSLSLEERRHGILKHLSVSKARFVKKIFGGSDRAYEKAIHEIAGFDHWEEAAHYIDEEIFTRNMVDMYSEAAVDFTDLLHAYFKRNRNQN